MKKSALVFSLICLIGLSSCGHNRVDDDPIETPDNPDNPDKPDEPIEEPDKPIKYKVTLDKEVPGFNVVFSNDYPKENEKVLIYIVNDVSTLKRIKEVRANDEVLTGKVTKDLTVYEFIMPKEKNVTVYLEVEEVYKVISTDENLVLSNIGDGYFAEGDIVSFIPATTAGYYYKDIVCFTPGVELTRDNEVYSFVMPSEMVSIGATTGKNSYPIIYSASPYYSVSIDSGTYFEFEETVNLKIEGINSDYLVNEVTLNGEILNKTNEFYSFTMPSFPCELEISYISIPKVFETNNSDHIELALYKEVNSEDVLIENQNTFSNEKVKIKTTTKVGEDGKVYELESLKLEGKKSENGDYADISSILMFDEETKEYSFNTSLDYYFYRVSVYEKEAIEVSALEGAFNGTKLTDISSSLKMSFSKTENSYHDSLDFTYEEIETNRYKVNSSYDLYGYAVKENGIISFNEDQTFMVYIQKETEMFGSKTSTLRKNCVFIFTNESVGTFDFENTYGIMAVNTSKTDDTKHEGILLRLTSSIESRTCYYDFTSDSIYWDVEYSFEGDALKENSIYTVTDNDGNELVKMKINSTKPIQYQYYADIQK